MLWEQKAWSHGSLWFENHQTQQPHFIDEEESEIERNLHKVLQCWDQRQDLWTHNQESSCQFTILPGRLGLRVFQAISLGCHFLPKLKELEGRGGSRIRNVLPGSQRMAMYGSWSLRHLDMFPLHILLKNVYDSGTYILATMCISSCLIAWFASTNFFSQTPRPNFCTVLPILLEWWILSLSFSICPELGCNISLSYRLWGTNSVWPRSWHDSEFLCLSGAWSLSCYWWNVMTVTGMCAPIGLWALHKSAFCVSGMSLPANGEGSISQVRVLGGQIKAHIRSSKHLWWREVSREWSIKLSHFWSMTVGQAVGRW